MSSSPSENAPARPPQVTLFGWLVIVSGVLVVFSAWETIGNAGSLATTELLETMREDPPFSGMGLEQLREAHRISAIVAAGAAGGAVVFAVPAMRRRDRSARVALSVLAVPVLLAGFVMGGLSSTLLAVAAMMLWFQPSRDWFDGKEYVPPEPREAREPEPKQLSHVGAPAAWAPPAADQRRADASVPPGPPDPGPRPPALLRACIMAGACSAVTFLLTMVALIALINDPSGLLGELGEDPALAQQGVTEAQLIGVTGTMLGLLAVWCLGAVVLAYLALRGAEWARIALIIAAVASGGLALMGTLYSVWMIGPAVAAGVTSGLLLRREVAAWCRQRSAARARR